MIVISTWPFGQPANAAAWKVLDNNGTALDAVEAGIMQCENDPAVQSVGYGGLPDASGEVTLDASITDYLGRCGAVACLTRIRNPIRVARLVMERTPHVMLVGEAATRFAIQQGIPEQNLVTDAAAQKFAEWKKSQPPTPGHDTISDNTISDSPIGHDTIGVLAIDSSGRMAGGCSTSGLAFKLPGRVGDSPIIGAGLYLEPGIGAATATGTGEEMMRVCAAHAIVENMRRGMEPTAAIRDVLKRIHDRRGNDAGDVSFLALRDDGAHAGMSLWGKTNFKFAVRSAKQDELITSPSLA